MVPQNGSINIGLRGYGFGRTLKNKNLQIVTDVVYGDSKERTCGDYDGVYASEGAYTFFLENGFL